MNLCSIKDIRAALADMQLQPRRSYGQNFLIDVNIRDIILEAAELKPGDRVLEVGPGLGVLTEPMAERCGKVVCVEKDYKLTAYLKERFADTANVEVIGSDIMRVDFGAIDVNKCVSNLPYSCGSRFLVDYVSAAVAEDIVVMVQDEVADKMCIKPGRKECGLMGLFMQIDYDVRPVRNVGRGCFWPRPEVDSRIVHLKRRAGPGLTQVEKIFLKKFAKQAFSQRRKKIGVLLRRRAGHDSETVDMLKLLESRRPEALTLEEWFLIARTLCGR